MSGGKTASPIPTLRVGSLRDALDPATLRGLSAADLKRFLMGRRWFGEKAATHKWVGLHDVLPLPWTDGAFAIARFGVGASQGELAALYQVPLCVRAMPASEPAPMSTIARVVASDGEGVLFDAVEDEIFRRHLIDSFAKTTVFPGGGTRLVAEPVGARPLKVPPQARISVVGTEQSNSSIVVEQTAILKLYRRVERGIHPELEMSRFLSADAGFKNTPALFGELRFEDPTGAATSGILQEYLPRAVDAWSAALERSRAYFAAPKERTPSNEFLIDAERLGIVTRAMHDSLATGTTDAFLPVRITSEDVDRWARRAKEQIVEALDVLTRALDAGTLPRERAAEGKALVGRREHYLAFVDETVRSLGSGVGYRLRAHGDFHLGQVLRTASGDFMIIDFEGEPARPIAERREKVSPLRDVAGMLRSFAYVAATLGGEAKTLDLTTREIRVGRWERDARDAFLRGYQLVGGGAERAALAPPVNFLPGDPEKLRAFLTLFETEKAFYELVYELNNRPTWAWVPLRGVAKLLAAGRASNLPPR
jgi:trehalose synthase-fused probable maltokinase